MFVFWLFIYLWFAHFLVCLCVCYVIGCFFRYSFIFVVAASGREGCVLNSFCVVVVFYFSFIGERLFYFACGWGKGFIFCW